MSRIHEALKKAEQERAASQVPADSGFATVPPMAQGEDIPGDGHADVVPLTSTMPSFASPFSLENLLSRCPQLQWKPDGKTMLFFNGDDAARGTEEFRTLRSRLYSTREKMTLKKVL